MESYKLQLTKYAIWFQFDNGSAPNIDHVFFCQRRNLYKLFFVEWCQFENKSHRACIELHHFHMTFWHSECNDILRNQSCCKILPKQQNVILSSAVTTRSSLWQCCTHQQWQKVNQILEWQVIPCPHRQAMGCLLWWFGRKLREL